MKRADIKVGMEVLVSRSREWEQWSDGKRYRIVDAGRFDDWSMGYARANLIEIVVGEATYRIGDRIRADAKGRGVLGVLLDAKTGEPSTNILALLSTTEIKASWAEAQVEIKRVDDARNVARAKVVQDRDAACAEAAELNLLLAAAGAKTRIYVSTYGVSANTVALPWSDLRILLGGDAS
jgi:hypothetical protein